MVIASAALLNNTGRALMNGSIKMMIVLNSLTSLNNECFLPKRVIVKASNAGNTEDHNLEEVN
jgi:hypothetical protein